MIAIADWQKVVPILAAMLTPVIALLATYIAWQQYKTYRDQFRLNLFERRLKVFDSTGKLIGVVLRTARVQQPDLSEFLWETKESAFLFGSDILAYLDELYGKATDIYGLENAVDQQQQNQRKETLKWFSGQGDAIKKKFGKYLGFQQSHWNPLLLASIFVVVVLAMGIYLYVESRMPKRVFLTRSQRYQDTDVKSKDDTVEDDSLNAEQRLSFLLSDKRQCIVLTHNKTNADYIVEITVERYPTDAFGNYADATLSITKVNGDVVLVEGFYQNRASKDDIAQQPISKAWEVLCGSSRH